MKKVSEKLKKYKWFIHWTVFSVLICLLVFIVICFTDQSWVGNVISGMATVSGIYLTIIIFLQSKEESDKQYQEHIKQLQLLNNKQIEALSVNTKEQIQAFQELTAEQIDTLQASTERQISALQQSTSEQISSFEEQINQVTTRLTDNSILLAEILGRELEKAMDLYDNSLHHERKRYNDLHGFKVGRTKEQRLRQINNQSRRIEQIQNGANYLLEKYKQLKNFIGGKSNKLIK